MRGNQKEMTISTWLPCIIAIMVLVILLCMACMAYSPLPQCKPANLYGAACTCTMMPLTNAWAFEPLYGFMDADAAAKNSGLLFVVGYSSPAFALLAAVSMCQWNAKKVTNVAWQDLRAQGYSQIWALEKSASPAGLSAMGGLYFTHTETLAELLQAHPYFVPKAYIHSDSTSPSNLLVEVDTPAGLYLSPSVSMNQGQGLGNMCGTSVAIMNFYAKLSAGIFFSNPILNDFVQRYLFLDFSSADQDGPNLFAPGVSSTPSSALMANVWTQTPVIYACGVMVWPKWWEAVEALRTTCAKLGFPPLPSSPPTTSFPAGHGGSTNGFSHLCTSLKGAVTRACCCIMTNMEDINAALGSLAFIFDALFLDQATLTDVTMSAVIDAAMNALVTNAALGTKFPAGAVVSVAACIESLDGTRLATHSADYRPNIAEVSPAVAEMAYGSMGSKTSTALNIACIVQSRVNATQASDLVKAMFTVKVSDLLDDAVTDKAFCCFQSGQVISGGPPLGFASYLNALFPEPSSFINRTTVGQCAWMQAGLKDLPLVDLELLGAYESVAFGPMQWVAQTGL